MIASVQSAPRITQDAAVRIVAELYGIEGSAVALPSERDQNFLIHCAESNPHDGNGEHFVLKIANAEESLEFLDLQNQMIQFLSARKIEMEFPRIVPAKNGESITRIKGEDGREYFVRLLSWLEGDCLAEVQPHGPKLLASLGRALGQMDAALAEFSHPAAIREFYWDLRNAAMAQKFVGLLPDHRRPLVERTFDEFLKIDW